MEDLRSGIPILCLVSVIYFWGNNVVLNVDKLTTIKYSLVPTYYTAPGLCHNPYVYLTSPYFEGKHFNHMTQRLVVLLTVHHFKVFSSILTWVLGETPEPLVLIWPEMARFTYITNYHAVLVVSQNTGSPLCKIWATNSPWKLSFVRLRFVIFYTEGLSQHQPMLLLQFLTDTQRVAGPQTEEKTS